MPELHLANRVKELTTTEGTGAVALEGALDGHQSFADSPITDGQTVAYLIRHRTLASEWEVGYGTFDATAGTLSRDTVLESPTDAKINFSSGDKIVFVGVAAEEVLLEGTAESISAVWDFAGGLNVGGVLLADGVGDIQDARVPVTAVTQHEAAIDHDALLNFVANEHVDHSAVVLTAGDGLKGGGDISASRTLNIEPADFAGAFLADDGLDNLEVLLAADGSLEDDGTGAIRVDATGISVGTLADARLSANVALLDRAAQEFTGAENYFTGGNVGIGTSSPTEALDILGTVQVSDDILFAGTGFRSRVEAIAMMAVEDLEDELIEVTAGFGSARRLGVNTDAYSITNDVADRTFDANATTTAELADVLATLIRDLGRDS